MGKYITSMFGCMEYLASSKSENLSVGLSVRRSVGLSIHRSVVKSFVLIDAEVAKMVK